MRQLGVFVVAVLVAAQPLAAGLGAGPADGLAGGAKAPHGGDVLSATEIHHILQPSTHVHTAPPWQLARRIQRSIQRSMQRSIQPAATGNLTYHNGAVMQAANNAVLIFWLPAALQDGSTSGSPSANFAAVVEHYFDDVGYSPLNQINAQYYQTINGPTEHIANASRRIATIFDTSVYPVAGSGCAGNGADCLDDGQVASEVSSMIAAHSLPTDASTEYYVFTSPHESTCVDPADCFKADNQASTNFSFCAYHSYFQVNSTTRVIYAAMPYDAFAAAPYACTGLASFPNDYDGDVEASTASYEQMGSTTDPYPGTGWFFTDTDHEIGDECAYNYGAMGFDGGLANEQWNGRFYAVQKEWSNAASGCVQGTSVPSPANDNFANALVLSGVPDTSGSVAGTNGGATKESGEPAAGGAGIHSVWYSIQPASSGQLHVDTCGSDFDTVLGVYTGSAVNALTAQANSDDWTCGHGSGVTVPVTAGTTYSIQVDGALASDAGGVSLHWWLAHDDRIVSVPWSSAQVARLTKMAPSLNAAGPASVQKTSTYVISYILGFVSPTPTPLDPGVAGADVTYTELWSPSEFGVIDRVKNKFVLSGADAERVSEGIVDYLLALGGH